MDSTDYFQSETTDGGVTFKIFRGGNNSYNGGFTDTGETVTMSISDVSAQSAVVAEGSDQEVSYRGTMTPLYDANGDLKDVVHVNDELREVNGQKRYVVRTKVGRPNDIDPELWNFGLDRANNSG